MMNRQRDPAPAPARPDARPRRARSTRPGCEPLEGRALLANFTAYDTTFGRRGLVIGAVDPDPGTGTTLSDGYAVAIQRDGKIVEVGTYAVPLRSTRPFGQLAVRRFNADGSVDATFGTNGQAQVRLPGGALGIQAGPRDVVVQADGSILLAATVALTSLGADIPVVTEGFVAKLTPDGRADPTFGLAGGYVFTGTTTSATALAVDAAGRILVLGGDNNTAPLPLGATPTPDRNRLVVSRLTAAGQLDTTFNGSGSLGIALPAAQRNLQNPDGPSNRLAFDYQSAAIALGAGGQIYAAGNGVARSIGGGRVVSFANLSRVNADGTLDVGFGDGGTTSVAEYLRTSTRSTSIRDMAFDAAGNLVVVGGTPEFIRDRPFVNRLRPDGTPDPTFAGNSAGGTPDVRTDNLTYNSVAIGPEGAITVAADYQSQGSIAVLRYTAAGSFDPGFGFDGLYRLSPNVPRPVVPPQAAGGALRAVALTADNRIVVAGSLQDFDRDPTSSTNGALNRHNLLARLRPVATTKLIGDYDGDGISDLAAYLPGLARFAYRPTGGPTDVLQVFGPFFTPAPAPGDYDGDGRTDGAIYDGFQGRLYRRASGAGDVLSYQIGDARSLPAPGDYDDDGKTDPAVYDPATGSFLILNSTGPFDSSGFGTVRAVPFGAAGPGASIPAPGDYDGDGVTDLAVYLPSFAILAYRPSSGGADVLTSFGAPGARESIPAPGDYDGDGRTDVAVYLPRLGFYAYRPSSGAPGTPDVVRPFGAAGAGQSIPVPGDYDGDGRFDLAVYLPRYGLHAYRPSSAAGAGPDVLAGFGPAGYDLAGVPSTIPAASIPYAQAPTVGAAGFAAPARPTGVPVALTDDVLEILAGVPGRKKRA